MIKGHGIKAYGIRFRVFNGEWIRDHKLRAYGLGLGCLIVKDLTSLGLRGREFVDWGM